MIKRLVPKKLNIIPNLYSPRVLVTDCSLSEALSTNLILERHRGVLRGFESFKSHPGSRRLKKSGYQKVLLICKGNCGREGITTHLSPLSQTYAGFIPHQGRKDLVSSYKLGKVQIIKVSNHSESQGKKDQASNHQYQSG